MEKKSLYLNKAQLKAQIERCLGCASKPCMKACPLNCSPQEFIAAAKEDDFEKSASIIRRDNPMGQSCGLICPDKFCMSACVRRNIDCAINIPKVQATIMEKYCPANEAEVEPIGKKIAIIGAGPAGLASATKLSSKGCEVVVFEASNQIGGALNLIPQCRLPAEVIAKDWAFLQNRKLVTIKLNTKIADYKKLLEQGFCAVIVAVGEQNVTKLGVEGEELSLSYVEYLQNPQQYATNGKVAVVGGGNVAFDCATTAVNLGAKQVDMLVRRKLSDMRIAKDEFLELIAKEINVFSLTSPEKIEKENDKYALWIHKNQFIEGKLQKITNSSVKLPDYSLIIKAIGGKAEDVAEEELILYAGDCKNGGSTAVEALASGYKTAEVLLEKFKK